MEGRDTETVSLDEVRRLPGGSALLDSLAEHLLSSGWAEAFREPTPSLSVFPFASAVLQRLRAAAKRLRQPCMDFEQVESVAGLGEGRRDRLVDALRELVRRAQLHVDDGGGRVPRLVRLVADADDEKDEDRARL